MSSESEDLTVAREYIVQMTDYWNRNTNISKSATAEPLVSTEEVAIKPERKIKPYTLERRHPETPVVKERKAAQEPPIPDSLLPRYSKEEIKSYFVKLLTPSALKDDFRPVLPADYIKLIAKSSDVRLAGINNIHRMNFVTKDYLELIISNAYAASRRGDLAEEIGQWLEDRGVSVEKTPSGFIFIDKLYEALISDERVLAEFIDEYNARVRYALKRAPNESLFLNGNEVYDDAILFEVNEFEGVVQERRDFIDFAWRSRVGSRRNHYEILKIFFEKFALDKVKEDKDILSSDSALKRYIIKKYKGSKLEKDFNVYVENFNNWMGSKGKKLINVFRGHPESSVEQKYKKQWTGSFFEIEEINSLMMNDKKSPTYINNNDPVFALTKYNEIVLIENFREFAFCYQMKTSDILDTAYSDSYLNFLIISYLNVDISGENETYSSRSNFAIILGAFFEEGEIPEPSNFKYEDSYAKVNLSYIKDQESNIYISVGSGSYWPEAKEGFGVTVRNRDNIFKSCLEASGSPTDKLEIDKFIQNIKVCVPCLNLNKKLPSFTLYEFMRKEDMISNLTKENFALCRDFVAIDDIVALFNFDDEELSVPFGTVSAVERAIGDVYIVAKD